MNPHSLMPNTPDEDSHTQYYTAVIGVELAERMVPEARELLSEEQIYQFSKSVINKHHVETEKMKYRETDTLRNLASQVVNDDLGSVELTVHLRQQFPETLESIDVLFSKRKNQ